MWGGPCSPRRGGHECPLYRRPPKAPRLSCPPGADFILNSPLRPPDCPVPQVLNIADFMLNSLKGPLCTKAYQRRATAYRALQQYSRAVADLEAAVANDPDSKELAAALAAARREQEEQRKQRQLRKAMQRPQPGGEAGGDDVAKGKAGQKALPEMAADENGKMDFEKLRRVEQLVLELQKICSAKTAEVATAGGGMESGAGQGEASHAGPHLPSRIGVSKGGSKASPEAEAAAAATTDPMARACSELASLLQDNDMACVYLRECGGLKAAAKVGSFCLSRTDLVYYESLPDGLLPLGPSCLRTGIVQGQQRLNAAGFCCSCPLSGSPHSLLHKRQQPPAAAINRCTACCGTPVG